MKDAKKDERKRDIRLWWERDPKGIILHRDRAPVGLRTPNGFVWAHELNHIFWIPRIPGTRVITVWSRSMIKELGEGYNDAEWAQPLIPPRRIRPWPVLKLLKDDGSDDGSTLNAVDKGCECEHAPPPKPEAPVDNEDEYEECEPVHPLWIQLLGECPMDPTETCTGPFVSNAGPERRKNAQGKAYTHVWCEHFKAELDSIPIAHRQPLYSAVAASLKGDARYDFDNDGIFIYVKKEKEPSVNAPATSSQQSDRGTTPADTPVEAPVAVDGSSGAASGPTSDETQDRTGSAQPDVTMHDATSADASATVEPAKALERARGGTESAADDSSKTAQPETKDARLSSLFTASDLPKLEEFIPDEYFPDILMVHDRTNATRTGKKDGKPIKYQRFYPRFPRDDEKKDESGKPAAERVAHLYLSRENRMGVGNHSYVYRAPLTLPPPLSARSPTGQVTVAAKLAQNRCTAHGLLHNEARMYDVLPKDTQEEWCGYNVVPQCRFPVPVGAVAPKFFGYYLPFVNNGGTPEQPRHTSCTEQHPCSENWASPILLMEECGTDVEPSKFTVDQRTECFSLIQRLHHMDMIQGSFYVRNIMIQPGPLSAPPTERTFDCPSFRIIDYGRGNCWEWEKKKGTDEKNRSEFAFSIGHEVKRAREQLLIEEFGF